MHRAEHTSVTIAPLRPLWLNSYLILQLDTGVPRAIRIHHSFSQQRFIFKKYHQADILLQHMVCPHNRRLAEPIDQPSQKQLDKATTSILEYRKHIVVLYKAAQQAQHRQQQQDTKS